MGVLTTAYSVPTGMMTRVWRKRDLVEKILLSETDWQVESYCFDKSWDGFINILCAFTHVSSVLNSRGKSWHSPSDYYVWTVSPSNVHLAAVNLQQATAEGLKYWGLKEKARDDDFKIIPESDYEYYIDGIESFKKFLQNSADAKNYLLFAQSC